MTTANAITVDRLSKLYQLGETFDPRRTFRELLTDTVRRVTHFSSRNNVCDPVANEKWALNDVSFHIKAGEVVGLIGPNGAGKSTLLKVMSRITDPSTGKITLRGRVGSLLEVGSGFHPELTGRENIFLYGAILGMSRTEITLQFDEIVAYAGVEQSIDTPVKRYSSGMYVRLAFAVAAFLRTDILFIDEVLAVGDLSFQRRCLGTVKDIANSGRTVVFVSHNMSIIQNLCQRVLLIDGGKLSFDGETEVGIRQYLNSQEVGAAHRAPVSHLTTEQDDFRFINVVLRNTDTLDHSGSATFSTGDAVSIVFSYSKQRSCPGLEIAFSLYDELGAAVCHFSSRLKQRRPDDNPTLVIDPDDSVLKTGSDSINTLTCTIGRLPLLPGRYRMNIVARNAGEILQHVSDAITFDVVSGDYFGTGYLPDLGAVAVDHDWHGAH